MIFKYLIYILLPFLSFLVLKIIFDKQILNNFFSSFKDPINTSNPNRFEYILIALFILFVFFEFFSTEYPMNKIDLFHEGQRLSAAFKSSLDGSLWSGSYIVVGVFHEIIGTKMIWSLTGHKTIGSLRFWI